MIKQPILVTGIHRSGSTWIGKVISSSSEVKYIHEPFNVFIQWANPFRKLGIQTKQSPFSYMFEYIDDKSSLTKRKKVVKFIKNFYTLNTHSVMHEIGKIRGVKDFERFRHELKSRTQRPLLKDPIALFSSEFLAQELNCKVIISIRHPAAFIASIIRKNWGFTFDALLDQERLIDLHLLKYKEEIKEFSRKEYPLIDQGILVWNIMYDFVNQLEAKHNKDWYFITHEQLSVAPLEEFEKIFQYLDLDFSEDVINQIELSTSGKVKNDLNRNSLDNIKSWKNILTKEEVFKINSKTELVANKFYDDDSWI
ncbi:sulfotransferase domain-containing protein [Winogradskyella wichelsiae]|uniref:sulfotransferase domain-containing protein n=1 Tax=Winogradskyella wichelsiae TaxID=2697007 RepID=UPI0015CACA85|nr:sulfotransferase domain-containing protein [Winogradskyella wichelsiae]